MEKSKINFFVDACMLLCGAALASGGFLMKFVLPPGKERIALYGRNVDLTLLGLDRHEWGAIHLWLAYCLIVFLLVHLFLHLPWIIAMLKKVTGKSTARIVAVAVFFLLCVALVATPFFITPNITAISSSGEHAPFAGKGGGKGMMRGGR